ncbi:hypothetical protein EDD18DRAFT_1134536 [Armillaria luteobubalina]|uniref:Ankyrin n=1 Tax=Armillaria luteobubalina TaxID=153913 RepID=A0AA39QJC6_9AGAR|nr:hypothetical protein EDD18DRAFT_1134536 [Armillaria luteobubalina]
MPPPDIHSTPQLPPTPRVRNKAFELALQNHLNNLGVKPELPWFQVSDPREIVDFIRRQQTAYQKTSKLHRSVDYWNSRIIEPLRQFFTAVDQGVSSHPEIGGIVWGCIRFIIETLSGHSRYFNKIVSVLEVISRDLPSYHQYATLLYRDSDVVQTALADVYGAILCVCKVVHHCFYGVGQIPRSSVHLFIRSLNPWNTSQLNVVIQKFQATTANLESKVNIERQVREHTQRQNIDEDRERARKKDEHEMVVELERKKQNLLQTVPRIDYQDKHESYAAMFSGCSPVGQWLLRTKAYQLWRACQPSKINDPVLYPLWIRGKRASLERRLISSVIVNDLKSMENVNPSIAVAYFYCEHDQTSKIDPLNILGTILYQLISLLPANSPEIETLTQHDLPMTLLNLKVLFNIVLGGLALTYIVIDALDECPPVALQHLLPVLVMLSSKAMILFTTRPNAPLIQWAFEGRAQRITVTGRDVNPDIEQYIRQCIVTADDEAGPKRDFGSVIEIRDSSLRKQIVDTLIKNAEGMFLWVRLQVQHLAEQRTDHDIRTSLQKLPQSLDATYFRSLDYIYRLDEKRRKRVQGVFRWLICAGSPGLDVELVRHAIAVDEMSNYWDSSMVVTNRNSLISDCANLVEFTATPQSKDKESKTVPTIQFIHTSVKDFLVKPSLSGISEEMQFFPHLSTTFLIRSLSLAHHIVFQSCFKSLSLLERRTDGPDPCPELSEYIRSPRLLSHLCNADDKDNPELGRLTGSFLTMLSMRTSPIQEILSRSDKSDLGSHTAVHIAAGLSCSNTMGHLLTHSELSVMKRDKCGRAPLHYAAGHLFRCLSVADNRYSCIQLLLQANADVNAVDGHGRTALQYIAKQGAGNRFMSDHLHPRSPVQLLLGRGANPNICDIRGETALHCASRCGWVDKQILQILVKHSDLNISNKNGETCLHVLMNNEMPDNDVLKTLLDGGADPNAQDVKGKTPLHVLVEKSRFFRNLVQTANTLLKCHLNPNARDNEGKTPLHILARATGPLCNHRQFPKGAASVGHNILELLLIYGADVHAEDSERSTPYKLIVKNNRIARRTSCLVIAASSQCPGEPFMFSTSKKAVIRPYDSTPYPWEEVEQSESRNVIGWSVPAIVLSSTAARM